MNPKPDGDLGATPHYMEPHSALMKARTLEVIRAAQVFAPRSQQEAAGPSEIGNPCELALAYKATGFKRVNYEKDGWQATVGTAVHAWLAEAFEKANAGQARYLVEHKIGVTTPEGIYIPGTLDVYDRMEAELIDHKVVGKQSMRKYSYTGSPKKYRIQAHIYGLGLKLKGEKPKRVGNIFYPAEGKLEDAVPWSEPFDEQIALDALRRYGEIHVEALRAVGTEFDYDKLADFPIETSTLCSFCPYYKADAPSVGFGCRGPNGEREEEAHFGGLV